MSFNRTLLILIVLFACAVSKPALAKDKPNRIISLAPAITEILYAIGVEDRIVGVTTFCDYPESAKSKPKVGGMSNPSLEAVVSMKPDIVIMSTDGNPKDFEVRLRKLGIKTYVFKARRINELSNGIRGLGFAINEIDKAESLAKNIDNGLNGFESLKKPLIMPTTLFVIWPEPLIAAGPGTAVHDAMLIAGFKNIAGNQKMNYPKYSIEAVVRQNPDVIIFGSGMSQQDVRKLSVKILNKLKSTNAVKNNRVYFVSDKLYRLGPRIIEGIEELINVLEQKNK